MFREHTITLALSFALLSCGLPPDGDDGRSILMQDSRRDNGDQGIDRNDDDDPPDSGTEPGHGHKGAVTGISVMGIVEGWAVNSDDFDELVFVFFYIDGNVGPGEEIGTAVANLSGFDGNNPGNHRFSFTLPEKYRDGNSHRLAVYMEVSGGEQEIENGPKTFVAYTPTEAGETFYKGILQDTLQAECSSCHSSSELTYANHYSLLINPSPAEGASPTSNRLYLKASGQLNHGGGDRCIGANSGICTSIAEWWDIEF